MRAGEQLSTVRVCACLYAHWGACKYSGGGVFSFFEESPSLSLRQKVGSIENRWLLVALKTSGGGFPVAPSGWRKKH